MQEMEPLAAWKQPKARNLWQSYPAAQWVAIQFEDRDDAWELIMDGPYSQDAHGRPGIVPEGQRLWADKYLVIPREYLSEVVATGHVTRVRRPPY